MDHFRGNENRLPQQNLAAAIQVWNRAAISLMDIRHSMISPSAPMLAYRLPSSAFVYTGGGRASVRLNDVAYQPERFGLLHAGKGTMLTIQPHCQWLEYYVVLYKAEPPAARRRDFALLLETVNPFRQQYGFTPSNPLFLSELLRKMYEKWKGPTPLNLFYGKSAFYQLVYDIYEELDQGSITVLEPDIVAMAQQFINQSYAQSISIQDMAAVLGVSYSHLHRLFSRQIGQSPQEYLMQSRLGASKEWLGQGQLSMREIARGTGFCDEYHFSRMFVRHVGMTPGEYRKKVTMERRDSAIGSGMPFAYNGNDQVSLDELKSKGVTFMFKQMGSKAIVAAALSLMMLLSACSAAPVNTSTASPTPATLATTPAPEETAPLANETRTISTVMGNVDVPLKPQKIAVWVYEQELHSLGITPVSVSPGNYDDTWPGITVFSYAPDKEELLSLEPDLLITYDDASFFENYSDIAPVICIPLATSAEDTLRMIGDVLNIPQKAEDLIEGFDDLAKTAKATMEGAGILGKTAVLVEPLADSIWIYDNAYGRGGSMLYDYLEFAIPEAVQNALGDKHFVKVSLEMLSLYGDADYIVVVTGAGYDDLKQQTIWQTLPAVKNGNVIEYDAANYNGRGLDTQTLTFFANSFAALSAQ